eukprot:COSAG04_NODE_4377_length_2130_cov_2.554407_1_plen_118_part_10
MQPYTESRPSRGSLLDIVNLNLSPHSLHLKTTLRSLARVVRLLPPLDSSLRRDGRHGNCVSDFARVTSVQVCGVTPSACHMPVGGRHTAPRAAEAAPFARTRRWRRLGPPNLGSAQNP